MIIKEDFIDKHEVRLEDVADTFYLEQVLIDYEISDFDTFEQYINYFWDNLSHNIIDVRLK